MDSKILFFIFIKWILIVLCNSEELDNTASKTKEESVKSTTTTTTTLSTTTQANATNPDGEDDWWGKVYENKDMLTRALYVLAAVTTITVLYFGIRFFSARRRRVKRYGLLSAQRETIALNPLNSDSEDDYTVFEARPLT